METLIINLGLISLGFVTERLVVLVLKLKGKKGLPISKYEGHERVEIPVTFKAIL